MMSVAALQPSYQNGYARSAGESVQPNLWRGLIGAWVPTLGPMGTTLRDVSGFGNHGTLTNMDPPNDWVIGGNPKVPGYVLDFDGGDDDAVDLGTSLRGTELVWSISVWFMLRTLPSDENDHRIISTDGDEELFYADNSPDELKCFSFGNVGDDKITIAPIALNTWQHAVVVNRIGTIDAYIDGENKLDNATFNFSANNTNWFIGNGPAQTQKAPNGQVGPFYAWNRRINPGEVKQLYNDPLGLVRLRSRMAVKAPEAAPAPTGRAKFLPLLGVA